MPYAKALANLVLALASYLPARSVVALSESPLFQHQYSSLTKAIAALAHTPAQYLLTKQEIQCLCASSFPQHRVYDFQADGVSVFREHSPKLEGRGYVHKANNVVPGNKPVGVGYNYSFVNVGEAQSSWSLPLDIARVPPEQDFLACAAQQLKHLCTAAELPFHQALVVNTADSAFGNAKYLAPTGHIKNLINIVRLRHGIKVYPAERRGGTGGAHQVYGEELFLLENTDKKIYRKEAKIYEKQRKALLEREPDEVVEVLRETRKKRQLRIEIRRWGQMMLRSKHGWNMKGIVFDIVGLRVSDAVSGERVLRHDMFLAVAGAGRAELSLEAVGDKFRHRFDLEVTNRLLKQNLKLQKYQTPDVQHLDNWMLVVQQAIWLLFAASPEVAQVSAKWQKYAERVVPEGVRKTAAQTHKASERLFLTFAKEPFMPQKCEKGVGRRVGAKQTKRASYQVVKKGASRGEKRVNEELRE